MPALPRAVLVVTWIASTAYVLTQLPVVPFMTNDTPHYLDFALTRPPAYGWFLLAFRTAGGGPDYAYLPLLQTLLIAVSLLAFAWQVAVLLRAPWAAAAIVPLVWIHRGVYQAARFALAEGLFLPALLAALACAAAYSRNGSRIALCGTAVFCSVAALSRTAGVVLLLVPLLLAFLIPSGSHGRWRSLALVALVAATSLSAGMGWQYARHGEFTLGSFAGQSLAGKAMLLLRPDLADDSVLAQIAPLAEQARAAVAAAPGYAASLRAQAQAYTDLRFRALFPAAEAGWPDWSRTDYTVQNRLVGAVARRVVAAEPWAYTRLVVRDWSSLVLYPHFWPWSADNTPHPFFARCAKPRQCWEFHRVDGPRLYGAAMVGTSIGGLLATALLLTRFGAAARGGRIAPPDWLMLALVLATQATLAGTALFEAGLWRYMVAPHVMHAVLLVWMVTWALRVLTPARALSET